MKIFLKKATFILVLTFVLILIITSCSKFKQKKSYIVATSPDNPPMGMITKDNKLTGFDINLIKAISKKSDFNIDIIPVIKENLIYGLIDGTYDIVISALSFPSELKTKFPDISFSKPYLDIGDVLVIPEDLYNFKGLPDLNGKSVGIKSGSQIKSILQNNSKIKLIEYSNISDAFTDMVRNKINAVTTNLPLAAQFVYYNDEYKGIFKIVRLTLTKQEYVIAVNKTNHELLKKINSGISLLKKSEELERMIDKWFFNK